MNSEYSYEDFEVQFGRTYVGNERLLHKGYFEKNYAEFLKARENNPNLQVNQFLDWSEEQKKGNYYIIKVSLVINLIHNKRPNILL